MSPDDRDVVVGHSGDRTHPDALFALAVALILVAIGSSIRSVALVPVAMFATVIMIDWVGTRIVLGRLILAIEARPTVVSLGEPVELVADVDRIQPWTRVDVGPQVGGTDLRSTTVDNHAVFQFRPATIGLIDEVEVSVRVVGLGFTSSTRQRRVRLRTPLHCGPRLDSGAQLPNSAAVGGSSATRGYVPGDRPNRINWSATARTGTLLVRSAGSEDGDLVIVVDSSTADADDLDWLCGPAGTIVNWWQQRSGDVRLVTREYDERRTGTRLVDAVVHDRQDLLRRLARVQPGPVDAAGYPDALCFAPESATG